MSVIDPALRFSQWWRVLTHDAILHELRTQVAAKKFTQKALADRLGIAPPRIKEVLNGERRIQPEEMPVVASWLGMEDYGLPDGARPVAKLPLVGDVPGGNWQEAIAKAKRYIEVPEGEAPKDGFALNVVGNSMDKIVPDGFHVIVDPNDLDLWPERLFVVMVEGEVTFKQYQDGPARLVPLSTDPRHKDIPITDRDYRIVGRITYSGKRHV